MTAYILIYGRRIISQPDHHTGALCQGACFSSIHAINEKDKLDTTCFGKQGLYITPNLRSTEFLECRNQVLSDCMCIPTLYPVLGNKINQFTILKDGNRRRRWWDIGKVGSHTGCCFQVLPCKYSGDPGRLFIILQGEPYGGTGHSCCTAAY